ncbi:transposase [Nonomuraea zeae]|uniref:Transposase n=1 Tax=Nonomuraea zeae TaxID=1642303 RepID=A0A5S4FFX7_9ACTN|nr:transposase [Nonomuraea zeae]
MPAEYGSWSTAYDRFQLGARAGDFERLMHAMIAKDAARGQADLHLISQRGLHHGPCPPPRR